MGKRFQKIYVEIANICNLNCDFCPKTIRAPQFMDFNLYKNIILQAEPLTDEITLHIMGEPLMHPQIKEIIEFAQNNNVRINLTTNGTLIKEHSKLLLNKTIRRVNFSVHGLKANFELNEQKAYLKNIIEFTKLAQTEREDLIVIYRLWNVDGDSNGDVIKIIEDEFEVKLEEETKKVSAKIKNNAFIHYDKSFEWPDSKDDVRTDRGYCHGLSTHIGILSDGTVVPCCLDAQGHIPLGNVLNNSIEEILLTKRAKDMKKGFQDRRLVEELCTKCTFIKRLERNRDKLFN